MGKMLAISKQGAEFMYKRDSAHYVSERGAADICATLNERRYKLQAGECWAVHDCGGYEIAYTAAGYLSFTRRNGRIYEKRA